MDLRQLQYFVAVSQKLNFSEAAHSLFMTQGTLSLQIKRLEEEIGTPLFVRTSHNVLLTDAGQELLPFAEKTLEDAENCRKKMNDLKGILTGTLYIGATTSFSALLTGTVRDFLKKYPGVKLMIFYETASELFEMLHNKKLDFILAFKPLQQYDAIVSETLFNSKLGVIMRKEHPLANRQSLTMDDLKKLGIVLPGSGMQARRAFERFIDIDTSDLNVKVELNDPNMIMDLVQQTNLVSIVSTLAVGYRPSLVAIPLEGIHREMTGCVHSLKDGYHKRAGEVFLQMLRDSATLDRVCNEL